jgi:hypothetical protein
MVNTKHDITSYENCDYQREIHDGNALYDAFIRSKKGSDWKPQVQKFEMEYLLNLAEIQNKLLEGDFEFLPSTNFVTTERGKTRAITGEQIHDRVVKHSLCDEVLTPTITKYLIHDNGASIKSKGIDFTRKRLLTHLRRYYAKHKSNSGYILLIDFSKYYDNIRHKELIDLFRKYVHNDDAIWLLEKTLERARIDVSYMTDKEYTNCMDTVFNSLEYQKIDKSLLVGEKFMDKHLNIGDQVAQIAGIIYPIPIDNFIKIVRGVKFYARYMDDSYIIHEDKNFLKELLKDIIEIANSISITVNLKKTRICKLSEYWRFLQIQYSLTGTGRVIQKINPKRLTVMRRKMKKLVYVLSTKEFENLFNSWFRNHYKIMSKKQRESMYSLYLKLREENYVYNNTGRRNGVKES